MLILPGSTGLGKGLQLLGPGGLVNPFTTSPNGVFYWDTALQGGYSDGQSVSSIGNFYPGGTITASQAISVNQPIWTTNLTPTGRAGLVFNGSTMSLPFSAEPFPTGNNNAIVYAYGQTLNAGASGYLINVGGSGGSYDNSHGITGNALNQITSGVTPDVIHDVTVLTTKRLAVVNRYVPGTRTSWVRGGDTFSASAAGNTSVTSGSSAIGSYGAGNYFNGRLFGVALFTGTQTDALVDTLVAYWVSLFG